VLSLNATREIIYNCEGIDAERALHYGLVNEIVPQAELMPKAIAIAEKMGNYPEVAFRNTKRSVVSDLVQVLRRTAEESKKVHRAAFAARAMQAHFHHIIGDGTTPNARLDKAAVLRSC
jgi:carboxymethylproline synthase